MTQSMIAKRARNGVLVALFVAAGYTVVEVRENRSAEESMIEGTPHLVVDRDLVDLGQVPLGRGVEASFVLSNDGDGDLVLDGSPWVEVVTGCCPSLPRVGQARLLAGERTTLTISFVMAGDMGGPHDFRIHIPSNDTEWGDRTLTVLSDWVEP